MRWIFYIIILSFLGCDDRGYGTQDINTIPYIGEDNPVKILSHTPEKFVAKRSYITISFSSKLIDNDLADKIKIIDETNNSKIEFTYEIVDNNLYILPNSSLNDQHSYNFTLLTGIKDIFENPLEKTTSFNLICKSNFWMDVDAGYTHSIAKSKDGDIYLWGSNLYGQLNDLTYEQKARPIGIAKLKDSNKTSAGLNQSGFILKDHNFISFGANAIGSAKGNFKDLSVGGNHTSVIKDNGTLWSYGSNSAGQLGNFGISDQSTFVQEYSKATNWLQTSAGDSFNVAIQNNGTLWGWGKNDYGQIGNHVYNQVRQPYQEDNNETNWKSVSAGGEHTCALKTDGTLVCFGNNEYGQLGDGTFDSNKTKRSQVINPDGNRWIRVDCGFNHTLALDSNNTLWGWGRNYYGELGQGDTTNRNTPQKILKNVQNFSAGQDFSLAILSDGTLWSWGYNAYLQLGLGETDDKLTPEEIK